MKNTSCLQRCYKQGLSYVDDIDMYTLQIKYLA